MKKYIVIMMLSLVTFSCKSNSEPTNPEQPEEQIDKPIPFELGFSIGISAITEDTLMKAKAAGIKYIEVSGTGVFIDDNGNFSQSDKEATEIMKKAKAAADKAGIDIWSIHMPFGRIMDLSLIDEAKRNKVVESDKKLISYLEILEPEIVLFHPSYYIEKPFRRALHISQLIKSAKDLNLAVQQIGATMVIENMLGPELMVGDRQRPLLRTVSEVKQVFQRLPESIGLGIDLNHIAHPEELILAMRDKVLTLHVADGTGKAENHWMPHPCSGSGKNNWNKIQDALYEVGYQGPFLYETSDYNSLKQLTECYYTLYNNYLNYLKK